MKFVIKKTGKQYRAYIIANNGNKLFWSERYKQIASARKAIGRVVTDALDAKIEEI